MKRFKNLFAFAAGLACAFVSAPAYAFSADASVALVSDYRWRGLSLSDEQPSLQLEASGSFDNGAWAWAGANTVSDAYGGSELGVGLGYRVDFAGLDWSIGAVGYAYPGEDDLDYAEIDLAISKSIGPLSVTAGVDYAPEQDNYETDNVYSWIGLNMEMGRFNLHGNLGNDDDLIEPDGHVIDYSLGAGVTFDRFTADLSYVESEADDSAWVLRLAHCFSYAPS